MLVYGKYECFVMHILYVWVLCISCGSSQFCFLHDLPYVKLVGDLKGGHMEETYTRSGLMSAL